MSLLSSTACSFLRLKCCSVQSISNRRREEELELEVELREHVDHVGCTHRTVDACTNAECTGQISIDQMCVNRCTSLQLGRSLLVLRQSCTLLWNVTQAVMRVVT